MTFHVTKKESIVMRSVAVLAELSQRILEKFTVFLVYDLISVLVCVFVFGIVECWFTNTIWFVLAYFLWYFYDRMTPNRGSRRIESLRNIRFAHYFTNYFPIKLHCSSAKSRFKSNENYIFCAHPHGIISVGLAALMSTDTLKWSRHFPGLKPHVVSSYRLFWTPIVREFLSLLGHVNSTKDSLEYLLTQPQKGYALGLVVGGGEEMALNHPNEMNIYLNERKGFIKMALTNGAHLVPVFSFGETKLYKRMDFIQNFLYRHVYSRWLRLRSFNFIFNYGCGLILPVGFMPFRHPIDIVVGEPIEVEQIKNPSQVQIDNLHELYKNRLVELFEQYKEQFIKVNASVNNNTTTTPLQLNIY